jgi:EAL domain-containing protein (putative c-di-GMP-specific phosphodiesterase class I)
MGKNVPLISMNVSRLHLFDEEFPGFLEGLTEKHGVPRELVEIEITESVFFDNTERLIKMISWFQRSGFVISMDDFGTGYSTLSLMKSLPIDILKIDGSFFMKSKLDDKNKAIISSIIHLSKKLNLKIVSEGIETPEQVEFLRSEECDYAQGYHYYKPMPAEEFEKLI